jgi:2-methylcitrate dehydratase PrpD
MTKASTGQTPAPANVAHGLTRSLADYSSNLEFDAIPRDVRIFVKHCLLDWLGVSLAGSREDAGRIVREEALH